MVRHHTHFDAKSKSAFAPNGLFSDELCLSLSICFVLVNNRHELLAISFVFGGSNP